MSISYNCCYFINLTKIIPKKNFLSSRLNLAINCSIFCCKSTVKLPLLLDGKDIVIDKEKIYSENGFTPNWKQIGDIIKSMPYGDRID